MSTFPKAPVLVFDIETVADLEGARRIYPKLKALNDADTLTALKSLRTQESGHDFMRLPLQRIVCISALYIKDGLLTLFSLTDESLSEEQIITKFFRAFKDLGSLPQLVSWNGSGFDIPVLIYRAMQYDLSVPLLFEEGARLPNMRFDNYVNRFQNRHLDLMDRFSQYGASRRESINVVASLYGLPAKTDIDGRMVDDLVMADDWYALAIYCESDVLKTWLIYLRWMRLTGTLSRADFTMWQEQTVAYLMGRTEADEQIRHQDFLDNWQRLIPNMDLDNNQNVDVDQSLNEYQSVDENQSADDMKSSTNT